jgi:hypothetical protein
MLRICYLRLWLKPAGYHLAVVYFDYTTIVNVVKCLEFRKEKRMDPFYISRIMDNALARYLCLKVR